MLGAHLADARGVLTSRFRDSSRFVSADESPGRRDESLASTFWNALVEQLLTTDPRVRKRLGM
ncbi:MAG TPA: hypothetical protein VF158_17855, partial [Longimicrobiales bacterium]